MTGSLQDPGDDVVGGDVGPSGPSSRGQANDNRRLSLGTLMGKGLVTGMRGLWEQPGASRPGALGKSMYTRAKGNPVSQSQDRGLLFKLSEEKTGDEGCPEQGPIKAARSPHGSSPPTRSNSQPGHSSIIPSSSTPPSDKTTPKSALKKMWKSMTHRSIKHLQHGTEGTDSLGQEADIAEPMQLPSTATLPNAMPEPEQLFSATGKDIRPADDQCAETGSTLGVSQPEQQGSNALGGTMHGMDALSAVNSPQPMNAASYAEQHEVDVSRSVSAPLDSPLMQLGAAVDQQHCDSIFVVEVDNPEVTHSQDKEVQGQQCHNSNCDLPAHDNMPQAAGCHAASLNLAQGVAQGSDNAATEGPAACMDAVQDLQLTACPQAATNSTASAAGVPPMQVTTDVTMEDEGACNAEARCEQWFMQVQPEEHQALAAAQCSASGHDAVVAHQVAAMDQPAAPTGDTVDHVCSISAMNDQLGLAAAAHGSSQAIDGASNEATEERSLEAGSAACEKSGTGLDAAVTGTTEHGKQLSSTQDAHNALPLQQHADPGHPASVPSLQHGQANEQGMAVLHGLTVVAAVVAPKHSAAASGECCTSNKVQLQGAAAEVGQQEQGHLDSSGIGEEQSTSHDASAHEDVDGMDVDEPAVCPTDNDAAYFWPVDAAPVAPQAAAASADSHANASAAVGPPELPAATNARAGLVASNACSKQAAAAGCVAAAVGMETHTIVNSTPLASTGVLAEESVLTAQPMNDAILAEHSLGSLVEHPGPPQPQSSVDTARALDSLDQQSNGSTAEAKDSAGVKTRSAVLHTQADVTTASEPTGMDWDIEMLSPCKPTQLPAAVSVVAPVSGACDGAEADLLGLGPEAPAPDSTAAARQQNDDADATAAAKPQLSTQPVHSTVERRQSFVAANSGPAISSAAAKGGPAPKLPPLLIAEPVLPEPHMPSPRATQLQAQLSPCNASPCGMNVDSPIPVAVSPVPSARKGKSISKDCNVKPQRFMPSVSIGTDALVSDLMAALQEVDEDDLQNIREAAGTGSQATRSSKTSASNAGPADASRAALGLIDMDMEDVTGSLVNVAAMHASAEQHGHGANDEPSASPRVRIHDVRASIPLFANTMMVTDSVSLDRQSLASIEPYAKPGSHPPAAAVTATGHSSLTSTRPAGLMASMITLDTLQEDECFTASDVPTPTNTRAVAAAKARAAASRHLDEQLPHNEQLGDPEALRLGMPATSQHVLTTPAGEGLQPIEEHCSALQASFPQGMGSQDSMDSPAVGLVLATPGAAKQPGADASSMPLKGAVRTPASTARRGLAGPGSMKHTAASGIKAAAASTACRTAPTSTPLSGGARRVPANKTAAHSHSSAAPSTGQKALHSIPSMQRTPNARQATEVKQGAAVFGTPGATKGTAAAAPPMPTSWATPLAQMQQLPLDFALNAPLLDGSPFPDFDNMDTTNIAEEASRLAHLALGGSQHGGTPTGGMPSSLMLTPHASSTGAQGKGTPTLLPGRSAGHGSATATAPRGMHRPSKSPVPGLMSLSPAAAGFLEAQNAQLMERLLAAEQRAAAAEQEAEQLKDQIKTMNFGDLLQGASSMDASDMEREARLCAEEQLQAANTQIARLQDTVHGLQGALQEEQARVKTAQTSAAHMAQELNSMNTESHACKAQLDAANTKASQLEDHYRSSQQQVASLHSELEGAKQQLAAAERDVTRLRQARDEALGSLKRSADELIAEQLKRQQQVRESNAQQAALHSSLNNFQADKERLRKELHDAQAAIKTLQDKYKVDIGKLTDEREQLLKMANELLVGLEQERARAASRQ